MDKYWWLGPTRLEKLSSLIFGPLLLLVLLLAACAPIVTAPGTSHSVDGRSDDYEVVPGSIHPGRGRLGRVNGYNVDEPEPGVRCYYYYFDYKLSGCVNVR